VATSSGFWASGPGRWLSSTKNIAGAVLGVAAIGVQALVGLGPFWPLVVVGAYAVGALVAPRDRIDLRLGIGGGAGATKEQLETQLKVLRRSLRGEARRLEPDASTAVDGVLGVLDEIVGRWDQLASAPDQRHTVEQMIGDYLPTSIQRYVNLPRTYALSTRVAGKRTAHDELIDQLGILRTEADRIRDAVYSRDLAALGDQGRFLQEKFGRSELEL
jgi:hypothetical protein